MKQLIPCSSRFLNKIGQNIFGIKEENSSSLTTTEKRSHSENPQQPTYYYTLRSNDIKDRGDTWDLSGGLLGI